MGNDFDIFPLCRRAALQFLGNGVEIIGCRKASGGFSGDLVVWMRTGAGDFALRRWRTSHWPPDRVRERHRWLRELERAGIPVAVPVRDRSISSTLFEDGEFTWQVEPWLPGVSVATEEMTSLHWHSLMTTLARMHAASNEYHASPSGEEWFRSCTAPSPAIGERLQLIAAWTPERVLQVEGQLKREIDCQVDSLSSLMRELLQGFVRSAPQVRMELQRLNQTPVRIFPCFRDLWGAHVLFSGDQVTGFIDATAARTEHPGTDLSRLLGSLLGDDADAWESALQIYELIRPLSEIDRQFIRVLDRSSVLLSGMTWIDRWRNRQIPVGQIAEVRERLLRIRERQRKL